MRHGILTLLLACSALASLARAQYAGQEARPLKALSEEELAQLRQGAGMGLAKVAELNHYPGPKHVLELERELALSEEQARSVRDAHALMHSEAVALGERILAGEQELEARFAEGSIDAAQLGRLTTEIGQLQGRLRATHLSAHLATRALLTPEQVKRYDHLRGYAQGSHHEHH